MRRSSATERAEPTKGGSHDCASESSVSVEISGSSSSGCQADTAAIRRWRFWTSSLKSNIVRPSFRAASQRIRTPSSRGISGNGCSAQRICPIRNSRRATTRPCRLSQPVTSRACSQGFRSASASGAARKMRPTPPGCVWTLPTASHSAADNASPGSSAARSPVES